MSTMLPKPTRSAKTATQLPIKRVDVYFSADVETDGPIPGPFSMLSFALVYAGRFDGQSFEPPTDFQLSTYHELKPISEEFQEEALSVNRLERRRLCEEGEDPVDAMTEASRWVKNIAGGARPVLVAYPLSFDWTWLYWYFMSFSKVGSPFNHSSCFDLKTAYAVRAGIPIAEAGRSNLDERLQRGGKHAHHALDDAIEQAQVFVNLFEWDNSRSGTSLQPTRKR